MIFEWGKIAVIFAVLASATAVAFRFSAADALPFLTGLYGTVLGVLVGNGRLARRGDTPAPLIEPNRRKGGGRRHYDPHEPAAPVDPELPAGGEGE